MIKCFDISTIPSFIVVYIESTPTHHVYIGILGTLFLWRCNGSLRLSLPVVNVATIDVSAVDDDDGDFCFVTSFLYYLYLPSGCGWMDGQCNKNNRYGNEKKVCIDGGN